MLDAALTDLLQPWRLATLLLSFAVSVLIVATSSRVDAQADALVVLATTLETPVLEPLAAAVTDEPELLETTVAGLPTTVARPGGGGEASTLVIVNGAAEEGRTHPVLRRLARGLARACYIVLVPDLPPRARRAHGGHRAGDDRRRARRRRPSGIRRRVGGHVARPWWRPRTRRWPAESR